MTMPTPGITVRDILLFHRTVQSLRRHGLDATTADQLRMAGPGCGGLDMARELLAAGPGAIRAVAEAQRSAGRAPLRIT